MPLYSSTGVDVGLEMLEYVVGEDSIAVSVCAQLEIGTLERSITVILSTQDGTATSTGMCDMVYILVTFAINMYLLQNLQILVLQLFNSPLFREAVQMTHNACQSIW